MRKLMTAFALATLFSAVALAENYTGKLLDSACYDQHKTAKACDATNASTTFLIDVSGKVYRLDEAGNSKAVQAMKGRADRSENPEHPAVGAVNAKISGVPDGDIIKVDLIEIQ